jgi:hypothetical protein
MADPKKVDVFISYSGEDKPWVSKFVDELEAQGVHAWYDEVYMTPGDLRPDRMEQALREAPVIAVLINASYLNSPWQAFELGAALAGDKRIIPIVMQEVGQPPSLPLFLRNRQLPQAAGKRVAEAVAAGPVGSFVRS